MDDVPARWVQGEGFAGSETREGLWVCNLQRVQGGSFGGHWALLLGACFLVMPHDHVVSAGAWSPSSGACCWCHVTFGGVLFIFM